MALSARVPSTSSSNRFIKTLFSKQVAEAIHNNLVCVPLVNSAFKSELRKGEILYIPKTNTATAYEVVVGTASTASNPLNTAAVTLTIDQWYDVKTPIDDMTARQSEIDLFAIARKESVYALTKKMDTSVNTLFSALNGSTVLGTDGTAVTDDVLLSAWETLGENDAPMEGRAIIVNPATVVDFMKTEKLVNQLYGAGNPTTAGFRGFHKVYGIPIYMTNNLTAATVGAYAAMIHKECIGFVAQEEPESEIYDVPIEHQEYVLCTALWGVIEVRDTFGVPFYTR
mgnify:CR=1 FL=1